jgi:predicted O-linked N-acetylglucosamine transferase (SPINDLY family)
MLSRLLSGWSGRRHAAAAQRTEHEVAALLAEGVALHHNDHLADAERRFLEVLIKDPRNAEALNLLGVVAHARLDYESALDYYQSALGIAPDTATFNENAGLALADLGRLDEALARHRRAHELDPGNTRCAANLLFLERVHPSANEQECFRAHLAWAARHAESRPRLPAVAGRCADPDRRLRLGYVSGDYFAHAVSVFLEPLFAHRDRTAFELYCYRTSHEDDEFTNRYRSLADHWDDVFALADDAFAELVRSHEIDILVDLAGITKGNRAAVIGRKPAPVQIGYLGYLGSTGIKAIDYRITDAFADPPGRSEHLHVEQLLRLPRTQWTYTPHSRMPEPLAAGNDGPVSFGSFHRLTKLHDAQLKLWAELLLRVPNARLELVDVPSDEVRDRVLAPFLARGISPNRIVTHPRLDRIRYWELVRRIHIGVDAYPYNGGASTCEVLWMGVPVVTRAGRHGFSRSGASILNVIGLPELVAESDAEYLEIAASLACDRQRLDDLRGSLRARMRSSPLLDAQGFMRDLEGAYRYAWRQYCANAA